MAKNLDFGGRQIQVQGPAVTEGHAFPTCFLLCIKEIATTHLAGPATDAKEIRQYKLHPETRQRGKERAMRVPREKGSGLAQRCPRLEAGGWTESLRSAHSML